MGFKSLSVLGLPKEFLGGDSNPAGGERGAGGHVVKLDERIFKIILIKRGVGNTGVDGWRSCSEGGIVWWFRTELVVENCRGRKKERKESVSRHQTTSLLGICN